MVRIAKLFAVALALAAVVATAQARPDKEEKTLKGTITCAKCDLHETTKCATVIKVKEGGKDVVYYLDDASAKKNHGPICQSPKEGSVTGTVSEKDGKKIVTATKVEFKKD
jgi:hypothetical protein